MSFGCLCHWAVVLKILKVPDTVSHSRILNLQQHHSQNLKFHFKFLAFYSQNSTSDVYVLFTCSSCHSNQPTL